MSVHFAQVGPHLLATHCRGAGAPVVLLHSGGLSSRQWRKLSDALVEHYQVVAPDLLGYGESSPWPVGLPFHFQDEVAAIASLLDALAPAHLVGHSYGALIALQVALVRPTRVRSLALFEPVAFGALDPKADADLLAQLDLGVYTGEPWLRAFVEWWNGKGSWDALSCDARAGFLAVGWKLSQEVTSLTADRTLAEEYERINAPTLLMGGSASPLAERRVLDRLQRALPRAELRTFASMGHMGPVTHPALVNAAILEHIRAHSDAA